MQAITLLKSAIALLLALQSMGAAVSPELRATILTVANEAIEQANYQIAHPTMTDQDPSGTTQNSDVAPSAGSTIGAQSQDQVQTPPASQARIEIISVDPSKPLVGTMYSVAPDSVKSAGEATETMQVATLGAIVYDADGNNDKTSAVEVQTDDATQDKTINGTGNMNGNSGLYYYPFNYLFRTVGDHTITFTVNGVSQSVTLEAQ